MADETGTIGTMLGARFIDDQSERTRSPMLDFEYGLSMAMQQRPRKRVRRKRPVFTYGPFIKHPKRAVPTAQRRQRTARRITRLNRK